MISLLCPGPFRGSFHDLYISELTEDGLAIKDMKRKTKLAGGAFEGVMIYKRGTYV